MRYSYLTPPSSLLPDLERAAMNNTSVVGLLIANFVGNKLKLLDEIAERMDLSEQSPLEIILHEDRNQEHITEALKIKFTLTILKGL